MTSSTISTPNPVCRSSVRAGGGELPTYAWSEAGPEHAKTFTVDVALHGRKLATGHGTSKKQAEQAAAALAIAQLQSSSQRGVTSG